MWDIQYPCFLQETFCSHRTLTVKKGGKCISNFFTLQTLGCCLGYWLTDWNWVAVMIIDWLTDWNWVNVLIIDWLTDWLKLGYWVNDWMADWQTDRLIDWNCVAVSVIDWLTDWLKGLVSKEIVALSQWGNQTQKFGMILHVNSVFHNSPHSIY